MYNGLFVNNVDEGLSVYFLKGPSCKGYRNIDILHGDTLYSKLGKQSR